MNEINELLADWERAPSPELRLRLLESYFAANQHAVTVYSLAGDRALLASEQKRADKAVTALVRIERALTTSASPTSLSAARMRLAAVS